MKLMLHLRALVATIAIGAGAASRWLGAAAPSSRLRLSEGLLVRGGADPIDVVCTLKGEKYEVSASTVSEVWEGVENAAGLAAEQQGLIFKGKKLTDGDLTLADAGVAEGDTISVVPSRVKGKGAAAKSAAAAAASVADEDSDDDLIDPALAGAGAAGRSAVESAMAGLSGSDKANIEEMMEQMGGREGMRDMLKQMGLDGPMTPDKITGVLEQIKAMFANPAIAQLFENPEVLEQSRQQILGNPMLMKAYDSMGMGGLIRDPDAFRQQMEGMKQMLENPEMLTQAMAGLMPDDSMGIDDFDQGEL